MTLEMYKALIELVQQGGTLALWGVGIWLVFTTVKVAILSLVAYLVVRSVVGAVVTVHNARLAYKATQVSLLSKEVTKDLIAYLDSFRDSLTGLLKDLELQFQASRKD